MRNRKKICVVTGTRAEYGLLYWLLKELQAASDLELQIIVTGMHLSSEFGLTYKLIEQDGFKIDYKVEILLASDTPTGISKSMGLALIGFADAFNELNPDLIVALGDRFEMFAAVSAATVASIPVAHLHGGENTEGAMDEAFRHSITKMSHIHFTATEEYRRRVIQLGEQIDLVFNFGAVGIENINRLKLLSRSEFERSIKFNLNEKNYLITYHPATLESISSQKQFGNLLLVLDSLVDTHLIFTKSNADTGGRIINEMIDEYVRDNPGKSTAFVSLGQLRYLSAMQYVDAVVGNSSSGIIEAPSFGIATINIGDRQRGRIRARSVIDCTSSIKGIKTAFERLWHESFQQDLESIENPYGTGNTAKRIVDVIRQCDLDEILKKKFNDINQQEIV